MPVHRDREKKESAVEEMEVEEQEHEASSTDEEDSETTSVSEDGDSSEMDEEDCERRRMECLDEMSTLEKQFNDLKVQLYRERLSQVNSKLSEVEAGRAAEYLEPLAVLLENMQVRTKVAGIFRELCLESVKNKYDCEIQAACQHWESEKLLLFDTVQSELEEKIRRLEEDRHNIDITSELWNDEITSRRKTRDALSPDKKRRRPSVVAGPYIVYMLPDLDILEDWTAIRKAVATLGPNRARADSDSCLFPFSDQNSALLWTPAGELVVSHIKNFSSIVDSFRDYLSLSSKSEHQDKYFQLLSLTQTLCSSFKTAAGF